MKRLTIIAFLVHAVLFASCATPNLGAGEKRRFSTVYMLYVPEMGETRRPVDEVLRLIWIKDRMYGTKGRYCFARGFSAAQLRALEFPDKGLRVAVDGLDITIEGAIVPGMGYCMLNLAGKKSGADRWQGKARVKIAPFFEEIKETRHCDWGLIRAPDDLVYADMISFLRKRQKKRDFPRPLDKDGTLTRLRAMVSMNPAQFMRERINPDFVRLVIREIEDSGIIVEEGDFVAPGREMGSWSDKDIIAKYFNLK